ncbi:MAG: NnrS family protein, partial [Bdellovibrionales bacterium]|nr:NnrS family protein [Bdellovibrionales bacterium]
LVESLHRQPIAPIYFLLGVGIAAYGILHLGIHLWLMHQGALSVSPNYAHLRKIHSMIQIHGFFGAFISGFTLQAVPRLMGSDRVRPSWTSLLPLLFLVSILIIAFTNAQTLGQALLSLHFTAIFVVVARYLPSAKHDARLHVAPFFLLGIGALAISVFLPLLNPLTSLYVLWITIIPILLSSLHVFEKLIALKRFSQLQSALLFFSYIAIALVLFDNIYGLLPSFASYAIYLSATFCITLILSLAVIQGRQEATPLSFPIALSTWMGTSWLGIAFLVALAFPNHYDLVLHLLATGTIIPILLTISSQILGALSGSKLLQPNVLIVLLSVWQLVPFSRGLVPAFSPAPPLAWTIAIIMVVVICAWGWALISRVCKSLLFPQSPHHPSCATKKNA